MKTMKNNRGRKNRGMMLLVTLALVCALAVGGNLAITNMNRTAVAESTQAEGMQSEVAAPEVDTSPAIYVAQKNANSVVGIITNTVLAKGSEE